MNIVRELCHRFDRRLSALGSASTKGRQKLRDVSAAEEETLVRGCIDEFLGERWGLNVEAYSLEAAANRDDSKLGLRISEQFRGVEVQ